MKQRAPNNLSTVNTLSSSCKRRTKARKYRATTNAVDKKPIIVGATGIYELDLEGISEINSLFFDKKSIQTIEEVGNAYLIVDALYEVQED